MLTDEDVWLERFKKNLETWEVREEAFLRWLDRKETFGKKLRVARALRNLSMREVAAEVGVTAQAISKYETAKMMPRPQVLLRLAELYGVSVDWLLCECQIDLSCSHDARQS